LLIIDHGIRGEKKSGLDVIPALRKCLPQSKIIMLSNYPQAQLEQQAVKAGASAFLVKINTPLKVLVNYVQKILN
jgi:DNA-binding NarL/FixJ family response regulator